MGICCSQDQDDQHQGLIDNNNQNQNYHSVHENDDENKDDNTDVKETSPIDDVSQSVQYLTQIRNIENEPHVFVSTLSDLSSVGVPLSAPHNCELTIDIFDTMDTTESGFSIMAFEKIIFNKPSDDLTRKAFLDILSNYSHLFHSVETVEFGKDWNVKRFNHELSKLIAFICIKLKAKVKWSNYDGREEMPRFREFLETKENDNDDNDDDDHDDNIHVNSVKEVFLQLTKKESISNDDFNRIEETFMSAEVHQRTTTDVLWYGIAFWLCKFVTNRAVLKGIYLMNIDEKKLTEAEKNLNFDELVDRFENVALEEKTTPTTQSHTLDFSFVDLGFQDLTTNVMAVTSFSFDYDDNGDNIRIKRVKISLNRTHWQKALLSSHVNVRINSYVFAWIVLHEKGGHTKWRVDTDRSRKTSIENFNQISIRFFNSEWSKLVENYYKLSRSNTKRKKVSKNLHDVFDFDLSPESGELIEYIVLKMLIGFADRTVVTFKFDEIKLPCKMNAFGKFIESLVNKENLWDEDLSVWRFVDADELMIDLTDNAANPHNKYPKGFDKTQKQYSPHQRKLRKRLRCHATRVTPELKKQFGFDGQDVSALQVYDAIWGRIVMNRDKQLNLQ